VVAAANYHKNEQLELSLAAIVRDFLPSQLRFSLICRQQNKSYICGYFVFRSSAGNPSLDARMKICPNAACLYVRISALKGLKQKQLVKTLW